MDIKALRGGEALKILRKLCSFHSFVVLHSVPVYLLLPPPPTPSFFLRYTLYSPVPVLYRSTTEYYYFTHTKSRPQRAAPDRDNK